MALFSRIHILHTSMDRLKEASIMVRWFHLSVLINSILRKIQGERKGEHELSRKSHKEHLIYHQQYVILQPHVFAFQPLLLLIFSSILSLHSYIILFGFWMHKQIWTKAKFSDFFSYTVQDFRQRIKDANSPSSLMGNYPADTELLSQFCDFIAARWDGESSAGFHFEFSPYCL